LETCCIPYARTNCRVLRAGLLELTRSEGC
jgi:hypothetical protein